MTLLDGAYFVAHNVLFDLSFLQEELIQSGQEGFFGPVLDTVELARILYPTADGYKLSDLAEREKLNHDRPHQADSDAQVTAELLLILIERLTSLPITTLKQLAHLSGGLKSDLQQLLDELLVIKEETVENLSETIEIFKELALKRIPNHIRLHAEDKEYRFPASEAEKIELVSQAFEAFEKRTGQFTMMDTVYQAFQNENHAVIEAGTGVGKSLGYFFAMCLLF